MSEQRSRETWEEGNRSVTSSLEGIGDFRGSVRRETSMIILSVSL